MPTIEHEHQAEVITPIQKLFIANRGEIAVRAARACQERNISAVIPYSLEDSDALITRIADQQGWELAPIGGTSAQESYSDPDKILEEATFRQCDAIFLGYGFLSENADFIRKCEEAKIRVLAPPSPVMDLAGNKIKARETAKKVKIGPLSHIPVLEGTGNLATFRDASKSAEALTYPVMLKDPDTGGGMGNLVVKDKAELESAYRQLRMRDGNREVYMEHLIANAVHVEVQIAADNYGNVVSLGERDCTMQRRHQKIIEESPSPNISPKLARTIQKAAINFAKDIDYRGVGTWEFIVDTDRQGKTNEPAWYFMEINPRIQVEHPVTEEQTGVDIVGLMIDIAEGRKLKLAQKDISPNGHTIEARVYAENPRKGFELSPGKLDMLRVPETPGIRVEAGVSEGDEISSWYDPTVLKAIAHGENREDARNKLIEFLIKLELTGVSSNRELLIELLATPEFTNSTMTTTFIERWWNNKLKEKSRGLERFIDGGVFTVLPPSRKLAIELLPQDVKVPRRNSDEPISYSQYRQEMAARRDSESYAEYGFYERDGIRYILYRLDGQLGIDEGTAFEDACKLANSEGLPLVTIVSSGGAEQQQNTIALHQMRTTIQALNKYPPSMHINVDVGGVYGGVPASFAGVADLKIIVEANTRKGFTGPFIVAKSLGLDPQSDRASDAYQVLPPGTHTSISCFWDRTVDIVTPNLEVASEKIAHLMHILNDPATITDPNIVFAPRETIGQREAFDRTTKPDQPGQTFVAWIRNKVGGTLWDSHKPSKGEIILPPRPENLPIMKRLEIIQHPDRPTTADLIDTRSELFDDAFFLSNSIRVDGVDQYPTVVAAITSIEGRPMCVIGHQTQRVKNSDGNEKKVYDPQKPKDWVYMKHIMELAEKRKLPLILLGDTKGADPSPEAESAGQSNNIAEIIKLTDLYPYPVLSINTGIDGSGGGHTIIHPADAAADFENALSFVSAPVVQWWIMTGQWKDENNLEEFLNQLHDATSQGRMETGQIDAIIPEGKGGAHKDPRVSVRFLRDWIKMELEKLDDLPTKQLQERRWERGRMINERVTRPN